MKHDERKQRPKRLQYRFSNLLLILGILCLAVTILVRVYPSFSTTSPVIITSSTLTESIDIEELSTAEYMYKGIAEVYKDEAHKNILCHVKYSSIVKAGIDVSKVNFIIEEEDKTITPVLPDITITASLVESDSLSLIPENAQVELSKLIETCELDALTEANESEKLLSVAEENLHKTIEALLYPIVEPQGYKLMWEDEKNGEQ